MPAKAVSLVVFWVCACIYAVWFGVQVWVEPGVIAYAGHTLSLLFFGAPVFVLAVVTAILFGRWASRHERAVIVFFVASLVLTFMPPPAQPMSHWSSTTGATVTTIPWLFWPFMVAVSVVPLLLCVGVALAAWKTGRDLAAVRA